MVVLRKCSPRLRNIARVATREGVHFRVQSVCGVKVQRVISAAKPLWVGRATLRCLPMIVVERRRG